MRTGPRSCVSCRADFVSVCVSQASMSGGFPGMGGGFPGMPPGAEMPGMGGLAQMLNNPALMNMVSYNLLV